MPGIDRPAMAAITPSVRGDVVMLDLGANVVCDTRNLVEFAVMGDVFARTVLGLTAPTIGLLNVGSEELKGDDRIRAAADLLRESPLGPQFQGFVEGHDIAAGTTDIIVTDGFTGNVALKTTEGTAKLVGSCCARCSPPRSSAKLGYLLARSELERLRELVDPRRYNGAVMVGLNGVAVKSHGGTDGPGFAHAVDVAMDMVVHHFNDRIREGLGRIGPQLRAGAANGQARNGRRNRDRRMDQQAAQPPAHPATTGHASRLPLRRAAGGRTCGRTQPALTRSLLAGIGAYLPQDVVSNDALAGRVETSDAWIRERTGIRQRHLAAPHETCAFMATVAARAALADAGADASEVDAILLGTSTPDQVFPATAVRVQAELGAGGFGFDLSAACSGFIYALSMADALVRSGQARGVLVIGAEVFSRLLNWQDRGTCVLFGDGAGAVFLRAAAAPQTARRQRPPASCRPICTATASWAISCMSMARPAAPTGPAIW